MCKGTGIIITNNGNIKYTPLQRKIARDMYKNGATLTEIAKKLNINHLYKVKSMMMSKAQ